MSSAARLDLPARLDLAAAAPLAEALKAQIGADLVLDARGVTHLGTPGLQVLLAARRSWEATGHALCLDGLPEALSAQLGTLGLAPEDFTTGTGADAAPPGCAAGSETFETPDLPDPAEPGPADEE